MCVCVCVCVCMCACVHIIGNLKIISPRCDTKHLMVRLQFWKYGKCKDTPFLPLLLSPLRSGEVVPVMVLCMAQIDLFLVFNRSV